MRSATTLPYRVCNPESVILRPWMVDLNGAWELLGQEWSGWDFSSPVKLRREFQIDTSKVKSDTGLEEGQEILVVVIAACPASRYREVATKSLPIPMDGKKAIGYLQFDLKSETFMERLDLETELILRNSYQNKEFVAHLSGSRLFSDKAGVQLEGNSSRFPMSTCNFERDLYRLGIPNARWYLWWKQFDYTLPVLQGLKLYINTKNSTTLENVRTNDKETLESMSIDIARQLLTHAVSDEDFVVDISLYPENSIGNAICGLFIACFPHMTKKDVSILYESDSSRFDAIIQSSLA